MSLLPTDGGEVFTCIDCGAAVWQAIPETSTKPRCYVCNWLHLNPDCPSYVADRLRNGRRPSTTAKESE